MGFICIASCFLSSEMSSPRTPLAWFKESPSVGTDDVHGHHISVKKGFLLVPSCGVLFSRGDNLRLV